jgi:ferredoxin
MSDSEGIRLDYAGSSVSVIPGQRLLDVILESGADHRHLCGGMGFCTSCRVEVLSGADNLSPVSPVERERLGSEAGRLRLACQTTVLGPASVRPAVALSSRFSLDGE